jgi:hypothetical protein
LSHSAASKPASPGALEPGEAWRRAKPGHRVVGWLVDEDQRELLLARFPPAYAQVVAHHVTLKPRVAPDTPLPQEPGARIVGRADDGLGVEAMVVELDGSIQRPDGGTYHVTWSLAPSRKPRESNDVIHAKGWVRLDEPVPVQLHPAVFG